MTLAERLRRFEGRPFLVALAAMNVITGLGLLGVWAPYAVGADAATFRQGAMGVANGTLVYGFLYAPLFGALLTPLTWLSPVGAALAMSGIAAAVLAAGVAIDTRGLARVDRVLIAIAVLGFGPVIHELLLGQVTLILAASIYPLRDRDGWERGIALGVVLALVPKPLFIPVLAWALLCRRRALAAATVAAIATTAAGILVVGPDLYRSWIGQLAGAAAVTRAGNLALTSVGSVPFEAVGLVAVVGLLLWTALRSPEAGFVASVLSATLAAPFTFAYGICVVLLAVRPAVRLMPRATRLLAITANIAMVAAYIPWAFAGMAASAASARGLPRRVGRQPD